MFQSPGVQNLLSQVSSNPQLLENMMQSPYMQDMMNQMVRNPELMNSVRFNSLPVLVLYVNNEMIMILIL